MDYLILWTDGAGSLHDYRKPVFRLARVRGLGRARRLGEAATRVAQQIALRVRVQVRFK